MSDVSEQTVVIRINPYKRTKISKGYCYIKSNSNSQLIILEDVQGNILTKTYANKVTYIEHLEPIFAKSSQGMLNIEVTDVSHNIIIDSTVDYENIKNLIGGVVGDNHEDIDFKAYYIIEKG